MPPSYPKPAAEFKESHFEALNDSGLIFIFYNFIQPKVQAKAFKKLTQKGWAYDLNSRMFIKVDPEKVSGDQVLKYWSLDSWREEDFKVKLDACRFLKLADVQEWETKNEAGK